MADPETGELVGCLVPSSWADQNILRERKYKTGDRIRATLTHPRNSKFHRLVHQLGALCARNIEAYSHLDSHSVIKQLQRDTGIACETQSIDAAPVVTAILSAAESLLGAAAARMLESVLPEIKTIDVLVPQSLSYDCLDESDFRALWEGICRHIVNKHWSSMTEAQITEMAEMMPYNEGV